MRAQRLLDEPMLSPASHPSIGDNIQGPSLVRVPDWVDRPLGRYYLYFADHKGSYIRLAFADDLTGPWTVHPPGSLQLADSCFLTEPPPATDDELDFVREAYRKVLGDHDWPHDLALEATIPHIASPDVHVDEVHQHFVMYFHGLEGLGWQVTRAATSTDGISFVARPEVIGSPYLRAFAHDGRTYAITMPGRFLRSADGLTAFESGPTLFGPDMRHAAVFRRGASLNVLWTRVGDAPEAILHSIIDLSGDWNGWRATDPVVIMRPERDWEGADAPLAPSIRSMAYGHVTASFSSTRWPASRVSGWPNSTSE